MTDVEHASPILSFEHTYEMSEAEYVHLYESVAKLNRRSTARLAAAALLGAAMLLSRFTAAIGGLILLICVFMAMMPRWSGKMLGSNFAKARHLHGPVAYGVSRRGF